MPRSLVLGNGSMLATFDDCCQMRDFYFPHVGMEDHTMWGHAHRVGVFVEGKGFAWFDDANWQRSIRYRTDTLVGESTLTHNGLGLEILVRDYVHPVSNILLRSFTLRPLHKEETVVKMFFHHDFYLYGDKQKDTAFYEPATNTVIHYREERYFLIGGESTHPVSCSVGVKGGKYDTILKSMTSHGTCGINAFSIGKTNYRGLQGTWKDAEDGKLEGNPIEQGSVDSTVQVDSRIPVGSTAEVTMWLCAGKSLEESLTLHRQVLQEGTERLERNCHNYWKSWVNKTPLDFGTLSPAVSDLYKRSLLIIRLHCDQAGGMVAAADADIMAFNKDTYTYVWPRDGAFVSLALDKAGYNEVTRRFYEFCARVQSPDGYMLHKYNPNGSVGSSWHPWFKHGEAQLPIQEDETALVVYAIHQHFLQTHDFEFLQKIYESFVKKAAAFMADFREEETGLPLPSYDPWEEHRAIFSYTTASTIAGLDSAAQIAHILGHYKHSERYQQVADAMRQALLFHLYDEQTGRFMKSIQRKNGQTVHRDLTPDISISAIWKLGVLPTDDPRVVSTMEQLIDKLTVRTHVGGLARYTTDHYHFPGQPTTEATGNPWIITTLWAMQWQIHRAVDAKELAKVKETFDWVLKRATSTGVLAEQYHAFTGEPLSVAPLTWSHATFVETVLLYLQKEKSLLSLS